MSSSRKPPPSNLTTGPNRRSMPPPAAAVVASSSVRGSSRSPTPTSIGSPTASSPVGMARRNTTSAHRNSVSSPLSARAAAKRSSEIVSESDLEMAAAMEDLRSRLAQSESAAEAAAEEYSKQVKALQLRLEETLAEQIKMEEGLHSKDELIESIELQVKELTRAKRDQDNIYEAERIAAQQEKEEMMDREEELNTIIQRLKDQLAQREAAQKEKTPEYEVDNRSRLSLESSPSIDESQGFAPSNNMSTPQRNNNLLLQKDKLIESLRLELAEAQIRLAEADHQGGTKLHQLEQQLLETRMTNARLMEDNESFQLLLSSAALNGDFPRGDYITNAFSEVEVEVEPESHIVKKVQGSPRNSISIGSNLAEELEEAAATAETEKYRKLESDHKALKDQNKAMSLYINNIIERILQHKDSEAILDKTSPLGASAVAAPSPPQTDKALPLPPSGENNLERARSLASRSRKSPTPSITDSSPKPPLQRSQSMRAPSHAHKRSKSDAVYTGASVVNNLYRGEGMITPRAQTFFGPEQFARGPQRPRDSDLSLDSTTSESGDSVSTAPSAPLPRSPITGPIAGNKLRPLRLVQENVGSGLVSPPLSRKISGDYKDGVEDEKSRLEKRQSKRGSWINWFGRSKEDGTDANGGSENVLFERRDVE